MTEYGDVFTFIGLQIKDNLDNKRAKIRTEYSL